jgi:hypothetical protein
MVSQHRRNRACWQAAEIRRSLFATLACPLLLAGCATTAHPPEAGSCRRLLENLDRTLVEAGVSDAGTARIPDFPQLRANRFLASFAGESLSSESFGIWLENLTILGNEARGNAWANLPPSAQARIRTWFSPGQEPLKIAETCAARLTRDDTHAPSRRTQLARAVRVPDDYDETARLLGAYSLLKWPLLEGVYRLHDELRAAYAHPPQPIGHWMRYAPSAGERLDETQIAELLRRASANSLGLPQPSEPELARLFQTFAPVWEVDTVDDSDRIGALALSERGMPRVDTSRPVVYWLISHARFQGQILLQLNYLAWFPARRAEHPLDIYAGRLDGLIWRVTLTSTGEPLAYDSIHPCGCYYQIFPGAGYRVEQPKDGGEPILSPFPLGPLQPRQRLHLRLSSRTHFIQGVRAESGEDAASHGWRDYRELLSLPLPGGSARRSLFNGDGFVAGSERAERFLLWPMGVANAGAMRQWGRHAIAFIGRRHFDDPYLLEKLLRPLRPAAAQRETP